jgi:hypothetical protein
MEATTIDMAAVNAAVEGHRCRAQRAVAMTVCAMALAAILLGALLPATRPVPLAGAADEAPVPSVNPSRPGLPHGS